MVFFPKFLAFCTLQIFTPRKLPGLGIAGSLQGKPVLSMEKGCKNHKETLCMKGNLSRLAFESRGQMKNPFTKVEQEVIVKTKEV